MGEAKLGRFAYHEPVEVERTEFCWVRMFPCDVIFLYRSRMSFRSSFFDKGSVDLKILETAFNLYGPTACNTLTCARHPTTLVNVDKEVNRAICKVAFDKLYQLPYSPDISSSILCMFPDDTGAPTYRIISPHVGVKVYEHLYSLERDKIAGWFRRISSIPETGTPVGWLWESYCHKTLATKSSLEITSLAGNKTEILNLAPSNRINFSVPKDLPKKPSPGYYAAANRNNKTFDAFSVTRTNQVVLMQFSVSPDDPQPNAEGLDDLADVLGKNYRYRPSLFIWVVPRGIEDHVRAQLLTAGRQNMDTMEQYVATLEV
jgi:hypothetical protein